MADVLESGGGPGAVRVGSVDWQKRCMALEMQLLRFRLQAGKIRELLAEKMQELEQRVIESDQRAESAEKQIHVMEEKLKSANIQTSESESSLCRKYQELTNQVQEKDAVIKRLEVQLEKQILVRAQEAKVIEEKAAKIKDWVTFKLKEMEQENQKLKMANLKQTEQIMLLQDKLQALLEKHVSSGSPATSPVMDTHLVPSSPLFPPSCPETPPAPEDSWRQAGPRGASHIKTSPTDVKQSSKAVCLGDLRAHDTVSNSGPEQLLVPEGPAGGSDRDNSSDELNSKFRSQITPKSPLLSRSPSTNNPFPNPSVHQSGASMTLPKVRTPLTPRDSIQLVKKHYSQPQPSLDRLHQLNVSIDIMSPSSTCSTLKSSGTSPFSQVVEETDIDDGLPDSMDGVVEGSDVQDQLDPPPTPPLHRFPSWESRIYAVAKSGMRVSEASPGARGPGRGSTLPQYPAAGPFTQLIYKNINVPVYTTLKGKATQISSVPLPDDDSGSEDDSSSLASLRTSILIPDKKGSVPGSPRAAKRGVSMSSISSESDYAIPPDAYSLDSDYSEPEHKVQRTSSYSCESTGPEMLEKSGYLLKMGSQVKAWKRRWFILRNGEILYYKSPSDVIRKPQGQIELNSSCSIVRGEGAQTFQLITEKKTFYLTADSPNILEEWIRVLQNILRVQASSPVTVETTTARPTVRGWLTKVKHGHSKLVWCSLVGKSFYYYRNQEDKLPLGQLQIRSASVQEVDRSCDSDEDYESGNRGFLSSHCTLVVQPRDQSPTYLLIGTKQEKDTWLYHLTVSAGSCANFKVGTEYEQLIGKLLDAEGDPESSLWKSEALSFCSVKGNPLKRRHGESGSSEWQIWKWKLQDGGGEIRSEQNRDLSCQLFINVLAESPSVDYHTSLAQNALQVCLTHPELQNEVYCQLIKQTNRRTPHNYSLTQCWQLLSLCVALFLPQQHFLWYLKQYLQRNADPKSEVCGADTAERRAGGQTFPNGDRLHPAENPYHHSLPFSIPVHFMNNTYQVVGFDGSTTVEEFLHTLNQRICVRKPQLSGFALVTDDPSGKDLEHCLLPSAKICDVISKWEQALKELHPGKNEGTRIVRLTYKSRLCFRGQVKGETERERLLLAYQVNDEVQQGHFPVNKELALEVAALMAQVEYSDLEKPAASSPAASPQPKSQLILLQALERFYPKRYKQDCSSEQLRDLTERLATKWSMLRGCSAPECVRIYLTVARKWPLFGAKLFSAKPVPPSPVEQSQVWLAVNEDGLCVLDYTMHTLVTYSYQSVITFGGFRDDFMVVTSQQREPGVGKKSDLSGAHVTAVGKANESDATLDRTTILELTLLMASYINHWNPGPPSAAQQPLGHWDVDSRHFPAMNYTTKGPTLL
ncbi:Pleckstrin like domain containing family H member 1 [Dissostichus eleginoides]|uniref:Pleckstrin like domain containing family H member 1 n=1 Tax=Dissostichus eleginoides TaxID=100907 RepID=A0AAD9C0W5_DISEL|nr:Pleckstrin like domain containing family H member 1 [Dissostichus eleginoides]